ncbi:MAG: class I SAM-dependent methyltransferase [Candidatus Izemoplasmataceae bacterium]
MKNIIEYGHALLKDYVKPDDLVIDMTAGNGHDTLFLAKLSQNVLAFDVLEVAIKNTQKRLNDHLISHVRLIHDSHVYVRKYIQKSPKAIVFNFGYLPGYDKALTTLMASSILALEESIDLIEEEGIIVMTLYPGHEEGYKEAEAITNYLKQLSTKKFTVSLYKILNRANAPFNITIYKHKGVSL